MPIVKILTSLCRVTGQAVLIFTFLQIPEDRFLASRPIYIHRTLSLKSIFVLSLISICSFDVLKCKRVFVLVKYIRVLISFEKIQRFLSL